VLLQTWRPVAAALGLAVIPLAASSGPLLTARPAAPVRTHPVEASRRPAVATYCSNNGSGGFIGNGYQNTAGGANSGVLDGQYNQACDQLTGIGTGAANVIYNNGVAGAEESFIAAGDTNFISQYRSFIGAGAGGYVAAPYAFIGSGSANTVGAGGIYAFVGAGRLNDASNAYASIDGGFRNAASAAYASIGGGYGNTASGPNATIPGGYENVASGNSSFAGGQKSVADTLGAFVWSDAASGATQLKSTAENQFLVRASGGTTFYSNPALTSGVSLAPGSGSWASLSDRTMKTAIVPLDDAAVLDKVVALPVSEWSYTSENGVRHVGPMAQDFYAAFKVGEDDRHITTIDEDGVALAAIKGLYAKSERNAAAAQRENALLRGQVSSMQRQLAALAAKVDDLEKR
jgi:hypothetical protein